MKTFPFLLLAFTTLLLVASGCDSAKKKGGETADKGGAEAAAHADDHDGDHDHAGGNEADEITKFHKHGPTGGEGFRFLGNKDFAGVVKLTGDDLVEFYFANYDVTELVPMAADSLVMQRNAEDEGFTLEPMEADEDGKIAGFKLQNRELTTAAKLGMIVKLTIGNSVYVGRSRPPH